MTAPDAAGFAPGATVEFTLADDPQHPQGEHGRILFRDYNGDFHIMWDQAGATVWSAADAMKALRVVSTPGPGQPPGAPS